MERIVYTFDSESYSYRIQRIEQNPFKNSLEDNESCVRWLRVDNGGYSWVETEDEASNLELAEAKLLAYLFTRVEQLDPHSLTNCSDPDDPNNEGYVYVVSGVSSFCLLATETVED